MSFLPELPPVSPVWAIVVLVLGLGIALGLDSYLEQRERRRLARWRPAGAPQRATLREPFSRAEDRLMGRKSARKQIRDTLGPLLGRAAILVRGNVPLRLAMQRIAESYPPNALRALIEEAVAASAAGEQFYAALYDRAVKTGYDPLILAALQLWMVARAGGDLANALRQSGRRADRARMHALKMAAQQVPMKMSVVAVFCLLPALWIIAVMPQLLQAMQAFSGVGK